MKDRSNTKQKTLTLNLSEEEMNLLETLAMKKAVSKTAVLKSAIKLYYVINFRISNGEKIFSEDISKGEKAELLLL
jgi:predicted transcriptional regulator